MLRRAWQRWKAIAHAIGAFQSRVMLNLFFFLILAPFAIGVKLLSDPLRITRQRRSHWYDKETNPATRWDHARRQF